MSQMLAKDVPVTPERLDAERLHQIIANKNFMGFPDLEELFRVAPADAKKRMVSAFGKGTTLPGGPFNASLALLKALAVINERGSFKGSAARDPWDSIRCGVMAPHLDYIKPVRFIELQEALAGIQFRSDRNLGEDCVGEFEGLRCLLLGWSGFEFFRIPRGGASDRLWDLLSMDDSRWAIPEPLKETESSLHGSIRYSPVLVAENRNRDLHLKHGIPPGSLVPCFGLGATGAGITIRILFGPVSGDQEAVEGAIRSAIPVLPPSDRLEEIGFQPHTVEDIWLLVDYEAPPRIVDMRAKNSYEASHLELVGEELVGTTFQNDDLEEEIW